MPFYEYECQSCKFYSEVMQKITDPPLRKCPSCGKNALKKLVSAPVFRLKGSGWYETDFKSDQEQKRNLAAADKEESKSEAKSETKDDAKPAAPAKTESPAPVVSTSAARGAKAAGGGHGAGKRKPAVKAGSRSKSAGGARAASRPKARPKPAARKGRR